MLNYSEAAVERGLKVNYSQSCRQEDQLDSGSGDSRCQSSARATLEGKQQSVELIAGRLTDQLATNLATVAQHFDHFRGRLLCNVRSLLHGHFGERVAAQCPKVQSRTTAS